MVLLYSNRSPEDIIYRDDLENIAAQDKKYKVVFSLDSLTECPTDWQGRCGYIDAAMIREEAPDYAQCIFYVCGPIPMVKKMVEILKLELGVADEHIRRESISGY
jgi:ferredoxin-NADP reductase